MAALALLSGALAVPSAQAAPGAGGGTEQDGGAGARHCALDASTGRQQCFGTFTEAVSAASGGRIKDAPASARTAVRDSGLRAETRQLAAEQATSASGEAAGPEARQQADGKIIQGTFFDDPQFGGDSLTVYGESLCKGDDKVEFQHNVEEGWKNRISSVQPWGDCWVWLYPEPDLGGDRDGPFKENTADIGTAMNDRTQSIGFS
ncbi:hypothetical protein [Streptomyces sp. ODS28]|uniref:hypothetical protein n=1 Tax=Streptomyces sp. ODS28 TaxID=3136688 RepID=UPI0031E51D6E